jgi:hypothetical protein
LEDTEKIHAHAKRFDGFCCKPGAGQQPLVRADSVMCRDPAPIDVNLYVMPQRRHKVVVMSSAANIFVFRLARKQTSNGASMHGGFAICRTSTMPAE